MLKPGVIALLIVICCSQLFGYFESTWSTAPIGWDTDDNIVFNVNNKCRQFADFNVLPRNYIKPIGFNDSISDIYLFFYPFKLIAEIPSIFSTFSNNTTENFIINFDTEHHEKYTENLSNVIPLTDNEAVNDSVTKYIARMFPSSVTINQSRIRIIKTATLATGKEYNIRREHNIFNVVIKEQLGKDVFSKIWNELCALDPKIENNINMKLLKDLFHKQYIFTRIVSSKVDENTTIVIDNNNSSYLYPKDNQTTKNNSYYCNLYLYNNNTASMNFVSSLNINGLIIGLKVDRKNNEIIAVYKTVKVISTDYGRAVTSILKIDFGTYRIKKEIILYDEPIYGLYFVPKILSTDYDKAVRICLSPNNRRILLGPDDNYDILDLEQNKLWRNISRIKQKMESKHRCLIDINLYNEDPWYLVVSLTEKI